ncbi:MAG: NPCBM/NEW2 domain-containing protein [Planctomycetota bacterium]
MFPPSILLQFMRSLPSMRSLVFLSLSAFSALGAQTTPSALPATPPVQQPSLSELAAREPPPSAIWVETLDISVMEQEWGMPQAARSVEGNPLTIGGQVFAHGIGSHANGELSIALGGVARRFCAAVGVDQEVRERGTIAFAVLVDGKEAARTPVMRGGEAARVLFVDLTGARELTLVMENGGDDINYDHADWGGAMIVLAPEAKTRPATVRPPDEPVPAIAAGTPPEPAIHAPRITGSTPGLPFLFRIPATGQAPLRFAAANLPRGLVLDPATGIITGSLRDDGRFHVSLTVEGPKGRASSTLVIVGGWHQLALTPPMGWNSWNVWGTSVDQAKVLAAAEAMVKSGLASYGYQYINIDDAWEGERDGEGRILTNEKFPDMKALADAVHAKGLKLGIYSSPGPKTCAGYEGSYGHEYQDATSWAEWEIDLVKYDWCSYGQIAKDSSRAELRKPYELMREALDECGRDIVYSLCQYGMGEVWEWGSEVGGNYWRTTGDISDSWSSMSSIGFSQSDLAPHAGPGHWNDPDMLVVGQVGWGPSLRATRLTRNEQITHITLWSLLAAPLLVGCDMTALDDFTLALLTNPEVLEVDQDPLGRQARRVVTKDQLEVWARPLADTALAYNELAVGGLGVGLFNRGRRGTEVTVRFEDLGLQGPQRVRNLWLRKDEGIHQSSFTAWVPRHGAVLLKIGG